MLRVKLAVEAPKHVIGIEVACGFEVRGGVELYAFAQVEGVGQPVRADVPAFGQRWLDIGGTGLEVDQAIEERLGRGVGGDRGGVLDDVEAFRARLGAHHQRLGRELGRGAEKDGRQGGT